MKKKIALALSLLAAAPAAHAKLRVMATVPELADLTRRIGGELVTVESIARGPEDIHQIVMRPSFVTKLNRADALVYLGLAIEHSFLPALLGVAANPRIRQDWTRTCAGEGCVDCSEGIPVLDKPETLSRAEGELHPQGNPHYNLSPENAPRIARNIAAGLSRVDPEHTEQFQKGLKAYLDELEPKLAEWRQSVKPLRDIKAVSYHKDMVYLGRYTGIEFIGTVELKPGVGPTPSHLERLVKEMRAQGVKLIVREQQYDPKLCAWLAERTGAKVAVIGTMGGAFPGTETFIKFTERNLKALLSAAGKDAP